MKKLLQHPLRRSIAIFFVAYIGFVLTVDLLGARGAYQSKLESMNSGMLASLWEEAFVFFSQETDPVEKTMDTKIQLINKLQNQAAIDANTTVPAVSTFYNSYHRGLLPILFFIALVLAFPVPIKRKLIAGSIGLLLLQLFAVFRTYISIEATFVEKPKLAVAEHSEFIESVILLMSDLLVKNIVIVFIVPLVLAALLLLRGNDIKRMIGTETASG